MSQVVRTQIQCPRCGHSFQAIVEQIVDVGADPQAKARFLSGRINSITCPSCGHNLAVATPILYHDPAKELLLIHVPMGLEITSEEREKIVGDMTRRLTESIPMEQRKGYLLQPRQALTIPGMIDTILEADGITAEMRESQREKMRVMEMFLQVSPEEWPTVIEEQAEHIDRQFFQIVLATAQNAAETGRGKMAEAIMILYNFVVQNSPEGKKLIKEAQVQDAVVREVAGELQALGQQITREQFMDLVISYAGDENRVQAVVGMMRPAMDYMFFQDLSRRIDAASGDEKQKLTELRELLLELTALIDQRTQAVIERAADTLRVIATSQDIEAAIRPRLDQIDDTFLAVLDANIKAAEQNQDFRTVKRLQEVREKVMKVLRESAPPQIQLINEILGVPTDEEAHKILEAKAPRFGPELLEIMEAVAQELDQGGQGPVAQRLRKLATVAAQHVGDAPQPPQPPEPQGPPPRPLTLH